MDHIEFEKMLEKDIKEMKEVPTAVEDKIQKAFQTIDTKEVKKQAKAWKWKQKLTTAASTITILFLAGNGVAYAAGMPNIYSWVLSKIGIEQAYEEVKTEVNQTVENNGVKMTVTDVGYDDNFFIIGYKMEGEDLCKRISEKGSFNEDIINLQNSIEEELGLEFKAKLKNDQKEVNLHITMKDESDMRMYHFTSVTSDNEIIMYYVADISNQKLNKITELEVNVKGISINALDAGVTVIEGEWNYSIQSVNFYKNYFKTIKTPTAKVNFALKEKFAEDGEPIITIQNGDQAEIKISQVQTSKIGSIITMETNIERGIMESTMPWYAFEILDSQGNIVKEKEKIANDNFFTTQLNENESYTVKIYVYECRMYADAYNLDQIYNFEQVASFQLNLQ